MKLKAEKKEYSLYNERQYKVMIYNRTVLCRQKKKEKWEKLKHF